MNKKRNSSRKLVVLKAWPSTFDVYGLTGKSNWCEAAGFSGLYT